MTKSIEEFDTFKTYLSTVLNVDAAQPVFHASVTLVSDVLSYDVMDQTVCCLNVADEAYGEVLIKETQKLAKPIMHLVFAPKFQTYKAGPDGASLRIAGSSRGKMGNYSLEIKPIEKASLSDME